jgi:hypothetical protein
MMLAHHRRKPPLELAEQIADWSPHPNRRLDFYKGI